MPTNESVEVGTLDSVLSKRAFWRTPQQFIIPLFQKVMIEQQNTIVQPYPPSGIAVVENADSSGTSSLKVDLDRTLRDTGRIIESSIRSSVIVDMLCFDGGLNSWPRVGRGTMSHL